MGTENVGNVRSDLETSTQFDGISRVATCLSRTRAARRWAKRPRRREAMKRAET